MQRVSSHSHRSGHLRRVNPTRWRTKKRHRTTDSIQIVRAISNLCSYRTAESQSSMSTIHPTRREARPTLTEPSHHYRCRRQTPRAAKSSETASNPRSSIIPISEDNKTLAGGVDENVPVVPHHTLARHRITLHRRYRDHVHEVRTDRQTDDDMRQQQQQQLTEQPQTCRRPCVSTDSPTIICERAVYILYCRQVDRQIPFTCVASHRIAWK